MNVKMPTVVGILTFMSRKNFMLSCVEHEKSFKNSGPVLSRLVSFKVKLTKLSQGYAVKEHSELMDSVKTS